LAALPPGRGAIGRATTVFSCTSRPQQRSETACLVAPSAAAPAGRPLCAESAARASLAGAPLGGAWGRPGPNV